MVKTSQLPLSDRHQRVLLDAINKYKQYGGLRIRLERFENGKLEVTAKKFRLLRGSPSAEEIEKTVRYVFRLMP